MVYVNCSYSLYDYGHGTKLPHPRDIAPPEGSELVKWIPQTMTDSIWCVYKFNNKQSSDLFISSKSDLYEKATKRIVDDEFLSNWKIIK